MNPQILPLLAGLAGRQGIVPLDDGGMGQGAPQQFTPPPDTFGSPSHMPVSRYQPGNQTPPPMQMGMGGGGNMGAIPRTGPVTGSGAAVDLPPPGYTPPNTQAGNMDGTGQGVMPTPFPGGGGAQGSPNMGSIMQLLGSLFGQGGAGGQGGLAGLLGGLMGGGQRGTGNQQGGFGGFGGGSNGAAFNPFQLQPFNPHQASQGMAPRAQGLFNGLGSNQQFYAPHNNVPQMNPYLRTLMALRSHYQGMHQAQPGQPAQPAQGGGQVSPVAQKGPGLGSSGEPVTGGRNIGKGWRYQDSEYL